MDANAVAAAGLAAYQDARKRLDEAVREAQRLADIVQKLSRWHKVFMVNAPDPYQQAPQLTINQQQENCIDFRNWPTAEQVHKALKEFQRAKDWLITTYDGVPMNRREGLPTPSQLLAGFRS